MIAAYAVILGGGMLITRRLHLLVMAAVFWIALAAGIGAAGRFGALHDGELGLRARLRPRRSGA